jgi:phage gp36-like protein
VYLTPAQYLQLEMPDDTFTGLSAGTVDAAIAWASSQANGYLRKRYALPLIQWGDDLRQQVAALATWQLLRKRGFQPGSGADDSVVMAKDDALRWLRDISVGHAELDDAIDSTPAVDEEGSLSAPGGTGADFDYFVRGRRCC